MKFLCNAAILSVVAWLTLGAGTARAVVHHATPDDDLAVLLGAVAPGDTLALARGVYHEEGLVVSCQLVIRGSGSDPTGVVMESTGQSSVFLFQDVDFQTKIENVTFSMPVSAVIASDLRGAAAHLVNSAPAFTDCRFVGLTAAYGGALYCDAGSSPVIVGCEFTNNRALAVGGAIALTGGSGASVVTTLFAHNSADGAGGVINVAGGSALLIVGCTMADNAGNLGSSLATWDHSEVQVFSSIIATGELTRGWAGDLGSAPTFSCSDLYANTGGDWVGAIADQYASSGNVSADPLFCGVSGGTRPYGLSGASPCAGGATPGCGRMGACPVACAAAAVPLPAAAMTRLLGNHPNPFNPSTTIEFELGRAMPVAIDVYSVAGRHIRRLVNGQMSAGVHTAVWDGGDDAGRLVAAGVYFYRMRTPDQSDVGRMAIVK